MDFEKLAVERYSVRKFSDRSVEQEKVDRILEACRVAPTAANRQPQRLLVIDDKAALEKLPDCTPYHFHAPLAILVCYDRETAWVRPFDQHDSGEVDASIVGTHLMMAAHELGLGSTWVMHFDPEAIIKAYNLPENIVPVALFPLGYPTAECKPSRLHADRLPLSDTTVHNSF